MQITFNLAQIVAIATALTSIITAYNLVRKPLKEKQDKEDEQNKKMLTLLDNDKKRLDALQDCVTRLSDSTDIQGDMIYAMLNHMATNNASGQMQSALDRYNSYYRKNH